MRIGFALSKGMPFMACNVHWKQPPRLLSSDKGTCSNLHGVLDIRIFVPCYALTPKPAPKPPLGARLALAPTLMFSTLPTVYSAFEDEWVKVTLDPSSPAGGRLAILTSPPRQTSSGPTTTLLKYLMTSTFSSATLHIEDLRPEELSNYPIGEICGAADEEARCA
uniref:Uncharacterized protein n=1 Tax=Physcomitrium patens TaxID=3218 RepID=A0A2K1K2U3_PHYPA|nr:hypothetical protein PHYPA_012574 [Physcomitrium patens]